MNRYKAPYIEKSDLEVATVTSGLKKEVPLCSFNGKFAQYYIGYAGSTTNKRSKIVGAVSAEMVEKAIFNLLGKGPEDMPWPVVLDLQKDIIYHTFHAHSEEISAIMGWNKFVARTKHEF
tara:strand:+ start:1079 stop:1438 length:360 start_codon:yes stop_codon:yes gene_type:complete